VDEQTCRVPQVGVVRPPAEPQDRDGGSAGLRREVPFAPQKLVGIPVARVARPRVSQGRCSEQDDQRDYAPALSSHFSPPSARTLDYAGRRRMAEVSNALWTRTRPLGKGTLGWWRCRDLNPGPSGYEPRALTS